MNEWHLLNLTKGTLKVMDMSHKNKYMGKVVGDGEEFVLCTLYTWMKTALCNHVQYSY